MAWTLVVQGSNFQRWSHSAISANGLNSSDTLDVSAFRQADIQVLHATHTDSSTYALDWSNDGGTTWERIDTNDTSGASGSTSTSVSNMPGGLFRLTVTATDANAASTLTPYVTLKRRTR